MNASNDMTYYLAAFVDELVNSGMTDVVISPGSRSTPIAILMAEHPKLNVTVLIDERSASFYALGLAKTTKRSVAILCTSGTAATNYYPAIVEAYQSKIPLIILTADRPHELRDVGAPQAIDQLKMYGDYVKWFVEMAIPADDQAMIQYARTMAARATGTSLTAPNGPVHLNFPLREPLMPNLSADQLWTKYRDENGSIVKVNIGSYTISDERANYFADLLKDRQKGVIICGEGNGEPGFAESITNLARILKYPIFADPLSGLRTGIHDKQQIIEGYDAFLRSDEVKEKMKPEVIIRFGAMPVSKFLTQYINKAASAIHIVVDGDGGWRDPTLQASYMVHCDERYFCEKLAKYIEPIKMNEWLSSIQALNEKTKHILCSQRDETTLFEGKIIQELQELLPDGAGMFVGNSMPIRDADTFIFSGERELNILANRGANGIDGIVSTALAASRAYEQFVLVIGDLSFYHDMNGLLAAKLLELNVTIVLVNNNGGGIFSFLPQSKIDRHFETLFGTPTHMNFEHAVKLYDGNYTLIKSWNEFRTELIASFARKGLNVLEVPTNRIENEELHRKLWKNVSQEMILSKEKEI